MNDQLSSPRCVTLDSDDARNAGGKAAGLSRLIQAGLSVPPGFAVMGADDCQWAGDPALRAELDRHYQAVSDGMVAVRSSASDEDGSDFSHAGQYETFLNVRGTDDVVDAVRKCLASAVNERSAEYRMKFDGGEPARMSVVVQRMVHAAKSGVIFTADPISGDTMRVVINAVSGLGESLVSGTAQSDHLIMGRDGIIIEENLTGSAPVLTGEDRKALLAQALSAERHFAAPLDLEWAIDADGTLFWLQARPITTTDEPGINELDTPVPSPANMYTRCNIGEMLPGAATPLTISVFAEAIDYGMRDMYVYNGVVKKNDPGRFICSFYNHQFMNYSLMARVNGSVAGVSPRGLELSILGRALEDREAAVKRVLPVRILNCIRYFIYFSRWKRRTREMERAADTFEIDCSGDDPRAIYDLCDRNMLFLFRQYINHYINSGYSGATYSILMSVLAEGKDPTVEHHDRAASYLVDIPGIESANVIASLEEIARGIAAKGEEAGGFASMGPAEALAWLLTGPHGLRYGEFIRRHGHRSIREAELREVEWAGNQEGLVSTIQSMVKGELGGPGKQRALAAVSMPNNPSRALLWAMNHARKGVGVREYSKSLVIKVQHQFKLAYRRIGALMADKGLFPDADLVYFFTHRELGSLLSGERGLIKKALRRRRLFPEQAALNFPDICRGKPVPVVAGSQGTGDAGVLRGVLVSRGMAEGLVRVVLTPEDARRLEPGDIMVARFTDIGWTPYYGIAAGLITEIGSSLSHGAVVAREYGLPMLVNVAGATVLLKNGERIRLNAYEGNVTRL